MACNGEWQSVDTGVLTDFTDLKAGQTGILEKW